MRYLDFENGLGWPLPTRNRLPNDALFLSRGRDALYLVGQQISSAGLGPGVLVPAFVCDVVPQTLISCGLKPIFYDVDEDLRPDLSDIERNAGAARAIVVVNYYGFPQPEEIYSHLKDQGLLIIEDDIQALPRFEMPPRASVTWCLRGFRKQLPLPDGAVLWGRDQGSKKFLGRVSPAQWRNLFWRFAGISLRSLIDRLPNRYLEELERDCFTKELHSRRYPVPSPMLPLTSLWYRWMDLERVARTRRRNYNLLLKGLNNIPGIRLFNMMSEEEVSPLGLPLLAEDRAEMLERLRRNRIAAAVLWRKPKHIEANHFRARVLWEKILVLPVGQGYRESDIEMMIEVIRG